MRVSRSWWAYFSAVALVAGCMAEGAPHETKTASPSITPLESSRRPPTNSAPALGSRRDQNDTLGLAAKDKLLGTPQPVLFSDCFDPLYEGTHPSFVDPPGEPTLVKRKYQFPFDQYTNEFFVGYTPGRDITELRYRIIAEAIDTRGTATKVDDVISRKAYIVQVRIPDICIDTVLLPGGRAGVDCMENVNASGGVPPLHHALEFVDATGEAFTSGPSSAMAPDNQQEVSLSRRMLHPPQALSLAGALPP